MELLTINEVLEDAIRHEAMEDCVTSNFKLGEKNSLLTLTYLCRYSDLYQPLNGHKSVLDFMHRLQSFVLDDRNFLHPFDRAPSPEDNFTLYGVLLEGTKYNLRYVGGFDTIKELADASNVEGFQYARICFVDTENQRALYMQRDLQ